MSSYDYYIWLRSLTDGLSAFLPLFIVAALVAGALVGWRWWLRARHGDPERVEKLEKRLASVEQRLEKLERRD